jgi:hypothetical protein
MLAEGKRLNLLSEEQTVKVEAHAERERDKLKEADASIDQVSLLLEGAKRYRASAAVAEGKAEAVAA